MVHMSVDFHMHNWEHDGEVSLVPYPGAVYDCPNPQCAFERKIVEEMSEWPQRLLDDQISRIETQIKNALEAVTRLRCADELKQRLRES